MHVRLNHHHHVDSQLNGYGHIKAPMWWNCGCMSQMVDSYKLEFNNATLRIVAPGTNDYIDLHVATYK